MVLLILIIIIIIIIIIYQSNNICLNSNNNNLDEIDSIFYYKLKNNTNTNCKDANSFNIKEFDTINDNIIIHNQFKKELIENINKKVLINNIIQKNKIQKDKLIVKQIESDTIKYSIEFIKNKINNISLEIKQLNTLLKEDINNLLNDIKNNNISKDEKTKLKKKLNTNFINNNQQIIKFTTLLNKNNFPDNLKTIYHNLLQKLLKLLNIKKTILYKKIQIYNNLLF